MPYFFDTTKLYRIWFSDDPDVFMNDENKLRFIQLRLKNPQAKLSLVYSSKCLSELSRAQLKAFCERIDITPVDFDTEIPALLTDEQDKQIYELARLEIEHTLNDTGGNLAAASDCVRTLLPLIQKYGCYSDFDVEIDFSKAPKTVKIYSPIVLTSVYHHGQMSDLGYAVANNDFIGVAYDSSDLTQLHPSTVRDLRKLQSQILRNYNAITPESLYDVKLNFESDDDPLSCEGIAKQLLNKYFEIKPQATLFDIRKFIDTLTVDFVKAQCEQLPPDFDADNVKTLKWQMYLACVRNTSGPGAYTSLFSEFLDKTFKVVEIDVVNKYGYEIQIRIEPQGKWRDYNEKCQRYGYTCNNLQHYVNSKQSDMVGYRQMLDENNSLEEDIGKFCDISWTKIGAHNQKARSQRITQAAITMQRAFRKRNHSENVDIITKEFCKLGM
ncbi:MAG: hypothetical protein JSR17_07025 [Proteobacteria bacterium]|nr:hypothetical protein [Pseudomonadota bacterium]